MNPGQFSAIAGQSRFTRFLVTTDKKGIRMALDAEAREAGVGTAGATIQIPVEYLERARRALERRRVPLDPMMTGIVIDAVSAPVGAEADDAPGDT